MIKEFKSINQVAGPLVFLKTTGNIMLGEIAEVVTSDGTTLTGQVLEVAEDYAVLQIFEGSTGIDVQNTTVRFKGATLKAKVGEEMLGRVFSGSGKPLDGRPDIIPEKEVDVNGSAINPFRREYPKEFIQTGVSSIDLMNSLVRGQKLPIFSGSGLSHNKLAAQITRQSTILGKNEKFGVVFAAMGITNEEAIFFKEEFKKMGRGDSAVMFLNLADDPAIERIITPRMALTTAEFLAYEKDMHVLVILTDLTNYCEALREISAARNEVPGRKGYPGYMYTDLANLYERAGKIQGRKGSVTMIPILSMPSDDKTHPIPDLTGYITEGQFVLNRELHMKGMYPPIDVLPSLSRLMKDGIGEGKTRGDHKDVANQLYALYAKGRDLRSLVAVVGEESLTPMERHYLKFADRFEKEILEQDYNDERSIEDSLAIAWRLLAAFPRSELTRVSGKVLEKYHKPNSEAESFN